MVAISKLRKFLCIEQMYVQQAYSQGYFVSAFMQYEPPILFCDCQDFQLTQNEKSNGFRNFIEKTGYQVLIVGSAPITSMKAASSEMGIL